MQRSFIRKALRGFVVLFIVFGSLFLAAMIFGVVETDMVFMFGIRINNVLGNNPSMLVQSGMEPVIWVSNGTLAITFYAAAFLFTRMINLASTNAQMLLDAAALLIRNKDAAGARILLQTIPDNPKAREWLAKLG